MDLHADTHAAVGMGGVVSEWFKVRDGVRQGWLIAPLLFSTTWTLWFGRQWFRCGRGVGVNLAYAADRIGRLLFSAMFSSLDDKMKRGRALCQRLLVLILGRLAKRKRVGKFHVR